MSQSAIRVLVLTSLFPSRPGEKQGNFILDQVRELACQGAQMDVLVARSWVPPLLRSRVAPDKLPIEAVSYENENFAIHNASFFSLPRFSLGRFAATFIRNLVPAIEYLDEQRPIDIIHAHGIQLGHAAVEAAARLRIPAVITIHGEETSPKFDNTELKRAQIADTLDRAQTLILVGSPLLDYIRRYTGKTDHCEIIGNGFTSYRDVSPSTSVPRSRPIRIIAVSNYEESKGFELLLTALASLNAEFPSKFETVLVGGGAGFDRIHQQVQHFGLSDAVHYTGPLRHRDVMAEVLAADVFCLPSWREAFGIMYAEAMSLGKFTIACAGQGPSDFIRHLDTGYLAEPRSATAVADALRWYLRNPDAASQIAARGRTHAFGNLTWTRNADRILKLYRSLITRQPTTDELRQSTSSATPMV